MSVKGNYRRDRCASPFLTCDAWTLWSWRWRPTRSPQILFLFEDLAYLCASACKKNIINGMPYRHKHKMTLRLPGDVARAISAESGRRGAKAIPTAGGLLSIMALAAVRSTLMSV